MTFCSWLNDFLLRKRMPAPHPGQDLKHRRHPGALLQCPTQIPSAAVVTTSQPRLPTESAAMIVQSVDHPGPATRSIQLSLSKTSLNRHLAFAFQSWLECIKEWGREGTDNANSKVDAEKLYLVRKAWDGNWKASPHGCLALLGCCLGIDSSTGGKCFHTPYNCVFCLMKQSRKGWICIS